jgi:hypothetical protein
LSCKLELKGCCCSGAVKRYARCSSFVVWWLLAGPSKSLGGGGACVVGTDTQTGCRKKVVNYYSGLPGYLAGFSALSYAFQIHWLLRQSWSKEGGLPIGRWKTGKWDLSNWTLRAATAFYYTCIRTLQLPTMLIWHT